MVVSSRKILVLTLLWTSLVFSYAAPLEAAVHCPTLSVSLQYGSRDATTQGQVSELQRFLSDYYQIPSVDIVTGFFGRITETRVKQFQEERGLPIVGIVGPRTRLAIAAVCGGDVGGKNCPIDQKPLCKATEEVVDTDAGNQCPGPWKCALKSGKPVIQSFLGPASLGTGEQGTWYIDASDPLNRDLTYRVEWGDSDGSNSTLSQLQAIASGTGFVATSTFAHVYESTGNFLLKAIVRNHVGQEVTATTHVLITNATSLNWNSAAPIGSCKTVKNLIVLHGQTISKYDYQNQEGWLRLMSGQVPPFMTCVNGSWQESQTWPNSPDPIGSCKTKYNLVVAHGQYITKYEYEYNTYSTWGESSQRLSTGGQTGPYMQCTSGSWREFASIPPAARPVGSCKLPLGEIVEHGWYTSEAYFQQYSLLSCEGRLMSCFSSATAGPYMVCVNGNWTRSTTMPSFNLFLTPSPAVETVPSSN